MIDMKCFKSQPRFWEEQLNNDSDETWSLRN